MMLVRECSQVYGRGWVETVVKQLSAALSADTTRLRGAVQLYDTSARQELNSDHHLEGFCATETCPSTKLISGED